MAVPTDEARDVKAKGGGTGMEEALLMQSVTTSKRTNQSSVPSNRYSRPRPATGTSSSKERRRSDCSFGEGEEEEEEEEEKEEEEEEEEENTCL